MVLHLKPVFKERIWGGSRLRTEFGYPIPSDRTGECWGISGHANGSNIIARGPYQGRTLRDLYQTNPALFKGAKSPEFPLLTKIIDAKDDLSVQVHPGDDDVKGTPDTTGKTECWYVLDAEKGASIILGHNAQSKEAFKAAIDANQWDQVLRVIPVHIGDFIYVPSGTVHAIKKGLLILETQQSSDTTYRLYDYMRKDASHQMRPLHIDQALDVMVIPSPKEMIHAVPDSANGNAKLTLISNAYFTVEKWRVQTPMKFVIDGFKLFTLIEGSGTLNQEPIQKGDHFIVTGDDETLTFDGDFSAIVSGV